MAPEAHLTACACFPKLQSQRIQRANLTPKRRCRLLERPQITHRPEQLSLEAFDGNPKTGWGIDAGPGRRNQPRHAVFAFNSPVGFESGTELTVQLLQKIGKNLNIGRFRISVTSSVDPKADSLPPRIRNIVSIPAAKRQRGRASRDLFSHFLSADTQYEETSKAIDELMKGWPYGPTTLALAECETPRETHIFKRGDWKRLGDAVEPNTPSFLHKLPQGAPRNRLGLAKWIVDRENPLTARVIVNRVWQQYYGSGLVNTAEDFGSRCELPSHPQLLDWLAVEFRENGWSLKKLHRLIVTSATYRQSSKLTPKLLEADPYNRWLARDHVCVSMPRLSMTLHWQPVDC